MLFAFGTEKAEEQKQIEEPPKPLTEEQKARLKEKLDHRTGKNVSLNCTVDPQCLGGIRIDYNDQRIDGTVANRLAAVSELLKNTAF